MTDKKTPDVTDEDRRLARKWAAHIIDTPHRSHPVETAAARVILHAVPAPKRPTLADMTDEERAACQWMQADVYDTKGEWVIRESPHSNAVQLVNRHGKCLTVAAKEVTPRPDLPRMTWPGDTPVAPDHLAVGTVIESADDPRIDALPLGTILLDRNEEATTKRPQPWGWTGLGNTPAEEEGDEPGPWTVLHIPKEADQ